MAGNLKRIEQTQKALLEELLELGNRFNDAYDLYFQALAPAVQKQLILAAYQICTQGYPASFLDLSVAERSAAQSKVRSLAQQVRQRLDEYFDPEEPDLEEGLVATPQATGVAESDTSASNDVADVQSERDSEEDSVGGENETGSSHDRDRQDRPDASELTSDPPTNDEDGDRGGLAPPSFASVSVWRIEDLASDEFKQILQAHQRGEGDDDEGPIGRSQTGEPDSPEDDDDTGHPLSSNLSEHEAQLIALALQAKLRAEAEEEDDNLATPNNLRAWQRSIESDIARILHEASVQANQLLQQCDILPQEFPLGLLEALGQGETMAESAIGTPNLLKLTIKAGSQDEEGEIDSETLQLVAIHLRLSEIEFAEASLSQVRHRVRQLIAELSGLQKRYAVNQQEYTIAQAEAAWRATWCEE